MLACAESNFSNFKFEYLRRNDFFRKTILACLLWAQMGLIHGSDTAPLTSVILRELVFPAWYIRSYFYKSIISMNDPNFSSAQ